MIDVRVLNRVRVKAGIESAARAAMEEGAPSAAERQAEALGACPQCGAHLGRFGDYEVMVQLELLQVEEKVKREALMMLVGEHKYNLARCGRALRERGGERTRGEEIAGRRQRPNAFIGFTSRRMVVAITPLVGAQVWLCSRWGNEGRPEA